MTYEHDDDCGRRRRKAGLRPEAIGALVHEVVAGFAATHGSSPPLGVIDDAVERLLAPDLASVQTVSIRLFTAAAPYVDRARRGETAADCAQRRGVRSGRVASRARGAGDLVRGAPSAEEIGVARRTSDYLGSLRCPGPHHTDRRNAGRGTHPPRHPSCRHVPSPGVVGGRDGLGREAYAEVTAGRDTRGGGSPQRRCLRQMGGIATTSLVGARSGCRPARVASFVGPTQPSASDVPCAPATRHGAGRDV
jgi:hypothetical protein